MLILRFQSQHNDFFARLFLGEESIKILSSKWVLPCISSKEIRKILVGDMFDCMVFEVKYQHEEMTQDLVHDKIPRPW